MRNRSAAKRASSPSPVSPLSSTDSDSEMSNATKPLLKASDQAQPNGHSEANGHTHGKACRRPQLLNYEQSRRFVPWQSDNEYVLGGYRPQLYSIRSCLYSAIGYVHNETVNIHSHSIAATFFAALLPLHIFPSHFPSLGVFPSAGSLPASTAIDKACMACYFVCAVTCLGLSSWFHTVQCCNKDVCDIAHCGDYVGIVVLIVGSILPGMYYGFHGQPILQGLYMTGILAAGLTSGYIVLSPHHRGHRWHRTLTFIALGLSAVVPVGHVVLSRGLAYAREMMGFDYIVAGGASYIFGALLYAARFPERLCPGKFDYVGSSHQIFHCFVLVGAWFQFAALRWMHVGRALAGV